MVDLGIEHLSDAVVIGQGGADARAAADAGAAIVTAAGSAPPETVVVAETEVAPIADTEVVATTGVMAETGRTPTAHRRAMPAVSPGDGAPAPTGSLSDGAGTSRRRWPVLAGLGVVVGLAIVALALLTMGGGGAFEVTDETLVYRGHRDGVVGLDRLPDGRILSASNDHTVQL